MVFSTPFLETPGKQYLLRLSGGSLNQNQRLHAKGWFKMYETLKLESNWFFNRYMARPCVFKRFVLTNVGMVVLSACFFLCLCSKGVMFHLFS